MTGKRKTGGETFACMTSTCDNSVLIWLNTSILKSRQAWAPGWLQREEIERWNSGTAGPECKVCKGTGVLPCLLCNSGGEVVEI